MFSLEIEIIRLNSLGYFNGNCIYFYESVNTKLTRAEILKHVNNCQNMKYILKNYKKENEVNCRAYQEPKEWYCGTC